MKRYLIVVDVQNDFCPGGALEVADGDKIIPNINALMRSNRFDRIIATQDWHPTNHISFASRYGYEQKPFEEIEVPYGKQMLWPDHCIMESEGADFRPSLLQWPIQFIVRKGYRRNIDSYSAFVENDEETKTGIEGLIERANEIYVCGIATDVCVLNTVLDALNIGLVRVVEDACAGVTEKGAREAIGVMKRFDAKAVTTQDVLSLRF